MGIGFILTDKKTEVLDFLGNEVTIGDFIFFTRPSSKGGVIIRVDTITSRGRPTGKVIVPVKTNTRAHPQTIKSFVKVGYDDVIKAKLMASG